MEHTHGIPKYIATIQSTAHTYHYHVETKQLTTSAGRQNLHVIHRHINNFPHKFLQIHKYGIKKHSLIQEINSSF